MTPFSLRRFHLHRPRFGGSPKGFTVRPEVSSPRGPDPPVPVYERGYGAPDTPFLSLMRFGAAFVVILYHFGRSSSILGHAPRILTAGQQVVTFFFVLSGFVLFRAYMGRGDFSMREFFVRRLVRIAPVYLLALVLTIAVFLISGKDVSLSAVLLNLLFLQSWLPNYPLSLNFPAWFMSDLVFCYVTFPFVLAHLRASTPRPRRFLCLALGLWLLTQAVLTTLLNTSFYGGYPSPSYDLIFYFPPSHYCSFFIGMAFGYAGGRPRFGEAGGARKSTFLLLLSLLVLGLIVEYEGAIQKGLGICLPFESSFYAPLWGLIILFLIRSSPRRPKSPLLAKPMVLLGEISFSVYILQVPGIAIFSHLLTHLPVPHHLSLALCVLLLTCTSIFLLNALETPVKTLCLGWYYQKAGLSARSGEVPVGETTPLVKLDEQEE